MENSFSAILHLTENIEDNLTKHILNILNIIYIRQSKTKKLVITEKDKSFPVTATTEDILNDPDVIVVDTIPQETRLFKGACRILPKEMKNHLLSAMVTGYKTIDDIKNCIVYLSAIDEQTHEKLIEKRLKDKIPLIRNLKYSIIQSNIVNSEIKNNGDELLFIIEKLMKEIEDISNFGTKTNSISQPQQANDKLKANTEKPQRIINDEALKPYFISSFKGMGNGNINYFEWLICHLQQELTPKAFAQIALMIYNSEKLNDTKPNTFIGWYKIFCECVGCEQKTYKPSQLMPFPEKLVKLLNYLS